MAAVQNSMQGRTLQHTVRRVGQPCPSCAATPPSTAITCKLAVVGAGPGGLFHVAGSNLQASCSVGWESAAVAAPAHLVSTALAVCEAAWPEEGPATLRVGGSPEGLRHACPPDDRWTGGQLRPRRPGRPSRPAAKLLPRGGYNVILYDALYVL